MLTDPGHIQKVLGALDKLTDAIDKICDVRIDATVPPEDRAILVTVIHRISDAKLTLSALIPPPPFQAP